jgi:hypothetical protein
MQIPRTYTTTLEATSTSYARKLQEFGFDSLTIDGQRSPFTTQDWNHLGDMSRSSYNQHRPDGPRPTPPLLPPAAPLIAFATCSTVVTATSLPSLTKNLKRPNVEEQMNLGAQRGGFVLIST